MSDETKNKFQVTWRGKNIEDCSKEELIQRINRFSDGRQEYYSYRESERNEELAMELKIKNEMIERILAR